MKRILLFCLLFVSTAACAVKPLVYFGDTLEWNTQWKRTACGKVSETIHLPEVSGIACSRVTPGYIWMESDDYTRVIATDEKGEEKYLQINFSNLRENGIRTYDWEDMCGGVYDGTNYLFVGAFGDNEEVDDFYTIIYFEEPAITGESTSLSITPSQIEFVYPDGKSHNCEAIMYDNVDQMIYIVTKVYYDVCQVFSLPFRLDYGDEVQTLTYECDLGVKSDLGSGSKPDKGFHLVTAADISPDGKYILIKNQNNTSPAWSWILLFTREEGESVAETLRRQIHPEPLRCYLVEWQGEAICWLDDETFYTTSDSDGEPPIYKYIKKASTGFEYTSQTPTEDATPKTLIFIDGTPYLRTKDGLVSISGIRL